MAGRPPSVCERLHRDEEGLEALQVVIIVAIAAIILALLKSLWPGIKKWFKTSVEQVIGWKE
jgi:hypothetical protein